MKMSRLLAACAVALPLLLAAQVQAETLQEALSAAYANNPTLNAARAGVRASDEGIGIARAQGLPSASLNLNYTRNYETAAAAYSNPLRYGSAQVQVSVPLYLGGSVQSAVKAADIRSASGRESLRGVEASVFASVVAAYLDVLQNQAIADLNRNQVKVLQVNLESTKDRFHIGDVTRTDVAQSEARLAAAQSAALTAGANYTAARENYVALVGNAPQNLAAPPPLASMPHSMEDAVNFALDNNPDMRSSAHDVKAAHYDVRAAQGQRLPKLFATASVTQVNYFNSLLNSAGNAASNQTSQSGAIGVQASIPLYQGGGVGAQIRASKDRVSQALEREIETERRVIALTRTYYSSWKAALDTIESSQKQVKADTLALEGVQAENSVGNRSVLDMLNAQQELLNSKVALEQARRNAYVAGFALLAEMGKANAKELGLGGGALYDPLVNYHAAKARVFDWMEEGEDVKAKSPRTIDISTH
jgi:outer membrane protein